MRRRNLATLLGVTAASWPALLRAQPAGRSYRIGFLGNSNAALEANLVGPFRDGLHQLGYLEDRNVTIEYRWAEGDYEKFPALLAELIALKVDVIVGAGTPAALAARKATQSLPFVMIAVGDPVATGLVASVARPGGNLTGLTSVAPELEGKRLQLLREVLPRLTRLAVLWNPASPFQVMAETEVQSAAQALEMEVFSLGVRNVAEIDKVLPSILGWRPDGLLVLADRLFLHNRDRIAGFVVQNRLPSVHAYRELVEAGGLMSYGPSYADMHRRAAAFVDKILRGARPADLPVERPAKFELVLNLAAARKLGLSVPPALLARADEVIG